MRVLTIGMVAIMKITIALLAVTLQVTGVLSVAAPVDAALVEECGDLGVLEVPEGADASEYRKCANHPLGENPRKYWQSLAPIDAEFVKRDALANPVDLKGANIFDRAAQACYYQAGLGCSGGYCWKACATPGDGKWCWTAGGDGGGPWLTCGSYSDCSSGSSCGKNCKPGNKACGCSC